MKLTVMERLGILNVLSPEGGITYLRAKKDIVGKVGLSADERVEYGIIEKNGQITWNPDLPQEKEISLSSGEVVMITEALKRSEKNEELHENQLSLYEKFVEN